MPEYLRSDLYIEERPADLQPIEGVGTTTAAVVGLAPMGPIDVETLITGLPQYVRIYGGAYDAPNYGRAFMYESVRGFFDNGGKRIYVVRTAHRSGGDLTAVAATRDFADSTGGGLPGALSVTMDAKNEGIWGNRLLVGFKRNPRCRAVLKVDTQTSDAFLRVSSTYGLKPGSEIEIEGSTGTKLHAQVQSVVPGNPGLVVLNAAVSHVFAAETTTITSSEFDVYVYQDTSVVEVWKQVAMWSSFLGAPNSDFIEARLNDPGFGSAYVKATVNPSNTAFWVSQPAQTLSGSTVIPFILSGGDDGTASLTDADIIGDPSIPSGLQVLAQRDDISMAALPGFNGPDIVDGLRTYVENKRYVFGNTAVPFGSRAQTAMNYRQETAGLDSNRIALYHPWGSVADQLGAGKDPRVFVPPEAFIMGIDARTDINRGVFKTGAGTEAQVRGFLDLEYAIDKGTEDLLNPLSIDCILKRSKKGIYVNGGRTTSQLPEYRYKSVVRTLIFIEQSLDESLQWATWEPNNPNLWHRLEISIKTFLKARWDEGYLVGDSQSDAFRVTVDKSNNPPSVQAEGKVIVDIGVSIVHPAEFVILRISQQDGVRVIQELGLAA